MRKLIGMLGLFVAMLLASCGGGGGYAGSTGPTNVLRMSPVLSGVTLPVGYFSDVAVISQGVKPYHVLSSDPSVRAVLLDDDTLRVFARGPGSSVVAVQDSSVSQTSISLTVSVKVPALSSSIGNTLTLSPGQSQSFTVFGGGEPYTAISNNPAVAAVSGGANGTYTITAGTTAGTAAIVITDAYGSTLTVNVSVVIAQALAAIPTTVTGVAGTSATVNIVGGVAPYSVTSSNTAVASVSASGSMATVNLLSAGTAVLAIQDASGKIVPVNVTVTAPPPRFMVIPPSQNLSETAAAPADAVTFTLLNGVGPYYATIPASMQNLVQPTSAVATGTTVTFQRVAGACIKATTTIPVTITDAGSGQTGSVQIVMPNDTANDATCP